MSKNISLIRKKPQGFYVQGVKKKLTPIQIAKLPKKEPSINKVLYFHKNLLQYNYS